MDQGGVADAAGPVDVSLLDSPRADLSLSPDVRLSDASTGDDQHPSDVGSRDTAAQDSVAPGDAAADASAPDAGGVTPISLVGFTIAGGADTTAVRVVSLDVIYEGDVPTQVMASESPDFAGAAWLLYSQALSYQLSPGDGPKTIHFKMRNAAGESNVLHDDIALQEGETLLVTETVDASLSAQTVTWNNWVTVTVPAFTVDEPTELRISAVPQLPAHRNPSRALLAGFDISLGDLHLLDEPVQITLGYNPAALNPDLSAEDQVAVAYWDTDDSTWVAVPVTVDPARGMVSFETRHLSLWSVLYTTAGYLVATRPHFRVFFDPDTGPTYLSLTAFEYAGYVGSFLEDAWAAYAAFPRPGGRVDAYIGDYSYAQYSGDIEVPIDYGDLEEVKFDMGHEYFHAVQLLRYGSRSAMDTVRWWMEATADYAAGRLASSFGTLSGSERFMGENIPADYLSRSITHDPGQEDRHKYHTSHLIDYLVRRGVNFKSMWDYVSDSGGAPGDALGRLEDYLLTRTIFPLPILYHDFAQYFLFDPSSPLPIASTSLSDIADYETDFEADRDEITGTMALSTRYTARLWRLPVEMVDGVRTSRILRPEPVSIPPGVQVRFYELADDQRSAAAISYNPNMEVGHSVDHLINADSAVYLLAAATTGTGSPEIKILDPVPHITSYQTDLLAEPREFTVTGRRFRAGSTVVMHPFPYGGTGIACSIVSSSETYITAVVCQAEGDRGVSVRCDSTGRDSDIFPVTVAE